MKLLFFYILGCLCMFGDYGDLLNGVMGSFFGSSSSTFPSQLPVNPDLKNPITGTPQDLASKALNAASQKMIAASVAKQAAARSAQSIFSRSYGSSSSSRSYSGTYGI